MGQIETLNNYLTDIANAIRKKKRTTDPINAQNFVKEILSITTSDEALSFLTFSSPSAFTLEQANHRKYWDGTLEYSTDARTWSEWNGTSVISSSADGKLYMRGVGNTYITGEVTENEPVQWVLTGDDISCLGNIENLLDYMVVTNGEHPIMGNGCYMHLFYNCTNLITPPELPAVTLSEACYGAMFEGCINLTTPPELPATTITKYCYARMFYGDTNLTALPELPATDLTTGCYTNMFTGCTNIKLSTTQVDDYQTEYRIPTSGNGTSGTFSLSQMFTNTGGTFVDTPTINTTYYTSNALV